MNKGAFHEYYNQNGGYTFSDGLKGVLTTVTVNGVADCFIPANIGTAVGHPQGLSEKYLHPHMVVDLRLEANAINPNEELLAIGSKAKSGQVDGISGTTFTEQVLQVAETTATLAVTDNTLYPVGNVLQIWDGTTAYRRTVVGNSANPITLDATIVKTAVKFNISGGVLPILSSGTSLKTNLIGSPTVYAQSVKDILVSGKYLVGIKTLITDETGASLIPDGILDTFKVSDKFTTMYSNIRSTDSGATYTAFTPTSSAITNDLTLTNEPAANFVLSQYTSKNEAFKVKDLTGLEVIVESDYIICSNTNDAVTDVASVINAITGKISVGTDNTEELIILSRINDILLEYAQTMATEDALISFLVAKDTEGMHYLGVYNSIVGSIDKTDGYLVYPLNKYGAR